MIMRETKKSLDERKRLILTIVLKMSNKFIAFSRKSEIKKGKTKTLRKYLIIM